MLSSEEMRKSKNSQGWGYKEYDFQDNMVVPQREAKKSLLSTMIHSDIEVKDVWKVLLQEST